MVSSPDPGWVVVRQEGPLYFLRERGVSSGCARDVESETHSCDRQREV
jgi:hypothetical protein